MERAWRNRTCVLNSNPNSNYQSNSRTCLKVEPMQIVFKAICILTFFLSSNPNILNISFCLRFKPSVKSLLLKTQVSFLPCPRIEILKEIYLTLFRFNSVGILSYLMVCNLQKLSFVNFPKRIPKPRRKFFTQLFEKSLVIFD